MKYFFSFFFFFLISCGVQYKILKTKEIDLNFITLNYFKHPSFKININDSITGNFIFDTGAYNTFIDSTFYKKTNFKYQNITDARVTGIGSRVKKIRVINDTIKIKYGQNTILSKPTAIIDLKKITGKICDGMIGYKYFEKNIIKFDYENEYFKLYSSIYEISDIKKYTKIPIEIINNKIFVKATIFINDNKQIEGKFIIDTGSNFPIYFTNETSQKFNLKEITSNVDFFSNKTGVGGNSNGFTFVSKSVNIGGILINKIPLYASTDVSGALASNEYDGILGNQILERFTYIIDPIDKELYLKPNRNKKKIDLNLLGFSLIDRTDIDTDYWAIKTIFKNSNAEKCGLKLNDTITKVDSIKVSKIDLKEFSNRISNKKTITVTVLRNKIEKNYLVKLMSIY